VAKPIEAAALFKALTDAAAGAPDARDEPAADVA